MKKKPEKKALVVCGMTGVPKRVEGIIPRELVRSKLQDKGWTRGDNFDCWVKGYDVIWVVPFVARR